MRREHHGRADRLRALGDAGIGHFQRRGRAQRAIEHANVEAVLAQRRKARRRRPRRVKARPRITRLWRRADDAGIDERTTGRRDRGGDALDRAGIDGVAVDIDRLGVAEAFSAGAKRSPATPRRRAAGSKE